MKCVRKITMTIEELIKTVEELNKRRGPKLALFIQTYYDGDFTMKTIERVKTQYQFMIEDWQTDLDTLEEAVEFILLWEKIHEYQWL